MNLKKQKREQYGYRPRSFAIEILKKTYSTINFPVDNMPLSELNL